MGSVFVERNHLFLRNPHGGVEDIQAMANAGFGAVFCNIGDHAPSEWQTIRARAGAAGVVCGPWLRTGQHVFDPELLGFLIDTADQWEAPLICNSESELKGTGADATTFIAGELGDRDAAISVECWPFADVHWYPLADYPILPQIFPMESSAAEDAEACRQQWYAYGIRTVVDTYGTYSGAQSEWYPRLTPYGLYTADDCAGNYQPWSSAGVRNPHAPNTEEGGDNVELIGEQHGIVASYNRMKKLDPDGCNPAFNPDDYNAIPLDQLKAWDKKCRTDLIQWKDHDEQVA